MIEVDQLLDGKARRGRCSNGFNAGRRQVEHFHQGIDNHAKALSIRLDDQDRRVAVRRLH